MKTLRCVPLLVLVLLWSIPAAADTAPPQVGGELPEIVLHALEDAGDMAYLGVDGKASFKIPEIQARLVIVEIFSMY